MDTVYINYVEVEEKYRRQGIGTGMINRIKEEFPEADVKFGMTTEEGTEFVRSIGENNNEKD